jgi:hypothetical protein
MATNESPEQNREKDQIRTLCRALDTLLLCIAALWVMPRSVCGRSMSPIQHRHGGEYDATTGAVINANLITGLGIPGVVIAEGLGLSGNALFVSNLITNCADQGEFYPALLNITAELRALVPLSVSLLIQ